METHKDVAALETLLQRVRRAVSRRKGISEKRMFGGYCFFANGNMIGGLTGAAELIVRVGPDNYLEALKHPHAREMDFTGRPMRGFVTIDKSGHESDELLRWWLNRGVDHARSLPPK